MRFPCPLRITLFSLCLPLLGAAISRGAERAGGTVILFGGVSGAFDPETNPTFSLEYRLPYERWGFRPWSAVGWATDGAIFAGAGLLYTVPSSWPLRISGGFGPGYYERHEGRDLGSHLEFLSFVEARYALRRNRSLHLRFAHVSNGSASDNNPGTELITLGIGFQLP